MAGKKRGCPVTADALREMYVTQGKTIREIAEMFAADTKTVNRWLTEFYIEIRTTRPDRKSGNTTYSNSLQSRVTWQHIENLIQGRITSVELGINLEISPWVVKAAIIQHYKQLNTPVPMHPCADCQSAEVALYTTYCPNCARHRALTPMAIAKKGQSHRNSDRVGHQIIMRCDWCGKEFWQYESKRPKQYKFCSRECSFEWQVSEEKFG